MHDFTCPITSRNSAWCARFAMCFIFQVRFAIRIKMTLNHFFTISFSYTFNWYTAHILITIGRGEAHCSCRIQNGLNKLWTNSLFDAIAPTVLLLSPPPIAISAGSRDVDGRLRLELTLELQPARSAGRQRVDSWLESFEFLGQGLFSSWKLCLILPFLVVWYTQPWAGCCPRFSTSSGCDRMITYLFL